METDITLLFWAMLCIGNAVMWHLGVQEHTPYGFPFWLSVVGGLFLVILGLSLAFRAG